MLNVFAINLNNYHKVCFSMLTLVYQQWQLRETACAIVGERERERFIW